MTLLCIPATAPPRFSHLTHASIDGGIVSVGLMSRMGLIGHVIDAAAATEGTDGLLSALTEEDRRLSQPLTTQQIAALSQEPWCR